MKLVGAGRHATMRGCKSVLLEIYPGSHSKASPLHSPSALPSTPPSAFPAAASSYIIAVSVLLALAHCLRLFPCKDSTVRRPRFLHPETVNINALERGPRRAASRCNIARRQPAKCPPTHGEHPAHAFDLSHHSSFRLRSSSQARATTPSSRSLSERTIVTNVT